MEKQVQGTWRQRTAHYLGRAKNVFLYGKAQPEFLELQRAFEWTVGWRFKMERHITISPRAYKQVWCPAAGKNVNETATVNVGPLGYYMSYEAGTLESFGDEGLKAEEPMAQVTLLAEVQGQPVSILSMERNQPTTSRLTTWHNGLQVEHIVEVLRRSVGRAGMQKAQPKELVVE